MEKVLYVLWRPTTEAPDAWRDELVGPVGEALLARGAHRVEADVADGTVDGAVMLITAHPPLPGAVLGVWVDSAVDDRRAPLDAVVAGATPRWGALLVTESVPLVPPDGAGGRRGGRRRRRRGPAAGRTPGYAQVAFLRVPAGLGRDEWAARWLGGQTSVAIATQATFGYAQHLVARTLVPLPQWPPVDAVVEELFPLEALGDLHAFFGSGGDDGELRRRMEAMAASTSTFIDDADLDVLPTSRFVLA
ncbi:MAG TPA: hypothetical protein VKA65_12260 [Acidimicrobiales bacterium]|nr:hypothetical protein [Acidimicrobiales bacterium]